MTTVPRENAIFHKLVLGIVHDRIQTDVKESLHCYLVQVYKCGGVEQWEF